MHTTGHIKEIAIVIFVDQHNEHIILCDWILENRPYVTLGQLHFIGPDNSHTHVLSMHHCIIGLGWSAF